MIKYNSMLKQMIALTALMVSSIAFAQDREYVIVVHGGAGAMAGLEEDPVKSAQYYAALDSALMIGDKVLSAGGEGPEAVMAVINYFEGNPLFNAGIGATCTVEDARISSRAATISSMAVVPIMASTCGISFWISSR